MRKRIIALGLSFIMMMSMAGCGLTDDSSSQRERRTEKASTEATTEKEADVSTATDVDAANDKDDTAEENKEKDKEKKDTVTVPNAFEGTPIVYSIDRTDYINDDDNVQLYSTSYDKLQLMEGTEDQFPGIKKALDEFNKGTKTYGDWSYDDIMESAKEQKANSEYFNAYYDNMHSEITRLDDKVISILGSFENYYGGAHGYYANVGYVYDSQTGKELSILDVVSSKEELKSAVHEIFSRDYAQLIEAEPGCEEMIDESIDNTENLCWSMGPTSLDIYFNPYEIASYASGMQTIQLRYADFTNLFNKGYGEVEDDWVRQTSTIMEDLDGDGSLDYANIEENMEYEEKYSYSYITGFTIDAGSGNKSVEYICNESTPYFIKKDGRYYIYVQVAGDSDSSSLLMYEITNGEIKELGEEYIRFSAPDNYYDYGEGYFESSSARFYNPESFYTARRMDLISTVTGIKPATIGEDGKVQFLQDYYSLSNFIITSKEELTFDEVDEDGNVIGEITVPSGSDYICYRTDDETYTDCKLSDGRIVRLNIEISENYEHTVNGKTLMSIFDGIIFAS